MQSFFVYLANKESAVYRYRYHTVAFNPLCSQALDFIIMVKTTNVFILVKTLPFSFQDGVVVTMKTVFPEELSSSGLRTESLEEEPIAHPRKEHKISNRRARRRVNLTGRLWFFLDIKTLITQTLKEVKFNPVVAYPGSWFLSIPDPTTIQKRRG